MRALDVFAMSSDTEQMPLGLLEAMACGLPVAATAVGDIPQMVAQENASFLVPRGAIDALASALRQLIDNPSLRAQIGTANLAKASAEYDQVLMFERYRQLFGR
jgi:glycosyltransferase involved in cell wall biosynthesis